MSTEIARATTGTPEKRRQSATQLCTESGPLNKTERATLKACETAIEHHIGAWVNVTNALLEVADRRLYRETHSTFEAYCRDRWGISRSQGHRIVLHGRVLLSPIGDKVRNEAQSRELASLLDHPGLLVKVVDRAEEIRKGKLLTAAALRQARTELLLPADEAQDARRVYEAAEWTQELKEQWDDRVTRIASRLTQEIPPSEWSRLHARINGRKPRGRDELKGVVRVVAFDAPLTEDVTAFLVAAQEITGEPITSVFTSILGPMSGMGRSCADMPGQLGEFGAAVSGALIAMVEAVSTRMSDVVVAMATAPPLPEIEWTAEKRALADERFSPGKGKILPPGMMLDFVTGGTVSIEQSMRTLLDRAAKKRDESEEES